LETINVPLPYSLANSFIVLEKSFGDCFNFYILGYKAEIKITIIEVVHFNFQYS